MRRLVSLLLLTATLAAPAISQGPALPHRHIYPDVSAAQTDIRAALGQAQKEHKRVIVDFGGDWCGDCQVLDIYFHQAPNAELLEKNFVLVHVNVGRIDENLDLGAKYHVNLKRGVPALAVLDARGKPLYGQAGGEFENMRKMEPASVTQFLNQWKPACTARC